MIEQPIALIVEDDTATSSMLARALKETGIAAVIFESGEEALEWLKRNPPPAFAMIDVMLPGMNGIHVARAIRETHRDLPLLIVTARRGVDDDVSAVELGAGLLEKPFRLSLLREAVRELVAESKKKPRARPRVLIVDDDADIRSALQTVVSEEGYDVVCAEDGMHALGLLNPPPDVAVIDVMMPGLDGPGLAARLKGAKPFAALPVVMISAFDRVAEHAAEAGAVVWLKKPFHLQSLVDAINRARDPR